MKRRFTLAAIGGCAMLAAMAAAMGSGGTNGTVAGMGTAATGSIADLATAFRDADGATAEAAAAATTADPYIRHDILVTTVDPAAVQDPNTHTKVPNQHETLVPTAKSARKGRLFLLVNGTGISEAQTQEVLTDGASRGYNSIAIAYPNEDAIATTCAGSLDDDCSGKAREEILTGTDYSPVVTIAVKDSLEYRLKTTLAYLQTKYPSEGWGKFLHAGDVDWAKVSAVGHSQGAGHVALLAKRHAMFRAVMISGVADITSFGRTAPWLFRPNATPIERQYGFTHVADYVVSLPVAEASWNAIGLQAFGPKQSVDGAQPDYAGSHMLTTALVPGSGVNPHLSMFIDVNLPRAADGTPAHRPVWEFLAFP